MNIEPDWKGLVALLMGGIEIISREAEKASKEPGREAETCMFIAQATYDLMSETHRTLKEYQH